ncbi:MAG: lysozyme [Xenococcus sp. (in: cyanobacteria)]
MNQAGLHLIEEFEGLARKLADGRITAYLDSVHVPTIGYGHTKNVHLGLTITQQQAEEFLNQDLRVAEVGVQHLVKVSLNDNQFAALVSFAFNLGTGALAHSTLLRDLNAGNYSAAADQFLRWNRAGGCVLAGLTRRREAERKLFLS